MFILPHPWSFNFRKLVSTKSLNISDNVPTVLRMRGPIFPVSLLLFSSVSIIMALMAFTYYASKANNRVAYATPTINNSTTTEEERTNALSFLA